MSEVKIAANATKQSQWFWYISR